MARCIKIHLCCLFLSCQVAAFGESCTDNSVCTGNTVCSDGNCTTCAAGYQLKTAKNGCEDINECNIGTSNCHSKADCTNNEGSFTCKCKPGYSGNGVSCTDSNECKLSNSCHRNAVCKNRQGGYTCTCKSGYSGDGYHCRDINECNLSNNCHRNAVCKNHQGGYTCTCKSGYSGDGYRCRDINECNIGTANCHSKADCTNNEGSFTCKCKPGYSGNGVSCTDINECILSNSCHRNAVCKNRQGGYTCTCKSGYSGDGYHCRDINECNLSNNCHRNAVCKNHQGGYTCTCKSGYSGDGYRCGDINECASSPCKYGGTCSDQINEYRCTCTNGYSGTNCQVAALGASCSQSGTNCVDSNASCQSNGLGGSTCLCISSYYDNDGGGNIGGTCTSKVGLGQNCPMPNACLKNNAECTGGTCRCTDNFYDTNTDKTNGGSCVSRLNLGGSCRRDHTNNKQCIDQNASCQGSAYICSCDARYHQDGSKCAPNIALGDTCTGNVANECSDPNAQCIGKKCTCKVGFYRFYEGSSQSNCRDVTELLVTGITFSNVKTTEFTVSWTEPTRFSYVSGYDVEWQTGGKVEGASSPQKVSGLTPGKVYELKVISKDTVTQPGVTRTTYTSKQQATKPSIPGAVTSSGNDLDARDGNILIRWTKGNGVATQYRVKLLDGESQKGPKETSSLNSWFSGALSGHNYSVVITARSEQFNGNYIWSEERVSSIKTKVQVPEKPRDGVCKSPTDSTITLDWDAPILPNGDLVRYHIDVMDTSNKLIFRLETTATETEKVVGNLQPGSIYVFRLYTENEQNKSSSYDEVSSACKTRAKMADPPTNVKVSGVTSRGFDISWEKPNNTYNEENYGYVLQIKDDEGVCWIEVIYRCSNCSGRFTLSNLNGMCDHPKQEHSIDKTKNELANKLMYSATLNLDIAYTVSITAINDAGRGHPASITPRTEEEVPINIEETLKVDVITSNKRNDVTGRQLTVSVTKDFFEESTNGPISATGLIVCLMECNIKGINTLFDFNKMGNWHEVQEKGLTTYRTTEPSWLNEIETQNPCGRKKRDVTNFEYTVGSEDCAIVSPDEFCNGPLKPATSYHLVAVSCTSGGCLKSRIYGPFTTATVAQCTATDCSNSAAIIIGVVLGVMNLILILYAGYATVLIRRFKAKDRHEIRRERTDKRNNQTYVNELFTNNAIDEGRSKNINKPFDIQIAEDYETEYTGLDDKTRGEGTYDIINSYQN